MSAPRNFVILKDPFIDSLIWETALVDHLGFWQLLAKFKAQKPSAFPVPRVSVEIAAASQKI